MGQSRIVGFIKDRLDLALLFLADFEHAADKPMPYQGLRACSEMPRERAEHRLAGQRALRSRPALDGRKSSKAGRSRC